MTNRSTKPRRRAAPSIKLAEKKKKCPAHKIACMPFTRSSIKKEISTASNNTPSVPVLENSAESVFNLDSKFQILT